VYLNKIMRRLVALMLLVTMAIPFPVSAAEGDYTTVVSAPSTIRFPKMTAYYEIHDPAGEFVSGLTEKQVSIVEDGKIHPVDALQEFRIGVQFSVVINAASGFSLRNGKGVSRYDAAMAEVRNWAESEREIATDDLSLINNDSTLISHTQEIAPWLTALDDYKPDFKTTIPNMQGISKALDLAGETDASSQIKHAVLWITPPPDEAGIGAIPNLIQRANSTNTKVYIWMISPSTEFNKPAAQVLIDFAAKTGGSTFAFSGSEAFPSIVSMLEPMRSLYQVTYTSEIATGGSHSLAVQVKLAEKDVTTLPVPFMLQVEAPNPIFVGLPSSLVRTAAEDAPKPAEALVPETLPVEILVEYPDNHVRALSHSALYVDDVMVAENTREPYEKFNWDLKSITSSGEHRLRVEVTDVLGMTKSTIEVPVKITIVIPRTDWWTKLTRNGGMIAILIALLALGMLGGVVLMTWRGRRSPAMKKATHRPKESDLHGKPVQPLRVDSRKMVTPMPAAQLLRLDENNQPTTAQPIVLANRETSFGSDVSLADVVIDSTSVANLHATITVGEDGIYYLRDLGTTAGTWLNFAPISSQPTPLEHGDCIHFGQVPYRFILAAPGAIRKPVISHIQ
jgi:hypothetical protein